MKKTISIILLILLPVISLAQKDNTKRFRTYVDLNAGLSLNKGSEAGLISEIKPDLVFGLNITGGYQFNKMLFAGIGFGGYTPVLGYNDTYGDRELSFYTIAIPIYADFRWTLDINQTASPFADIKLGYQFGSPISRSLESWSSHSEYDMIYQKNGLYFQPSVGIRLGKRSAFNLGLAYNFSIKQSFDIYGRLNGDYAPERIGKVNTSSGALMLTLGADF